MGFSPLHCFENYKELLKESVFRTPHGFESLVSPPPPPPTFKVAPRALFFFALQTLSSLLESSSPQCENLWELAHTGDSFENRPKILMPRKTKRLLTESLGSYQTRSNNYEPKII